MGQTLSEPETTKHTSAGEDDRLVWAVSEMQGWRLSMEDAHATILDLDNPDDSAAAQCGPGKKGKTSFFAVYDGHGGSTVARFSGETVHKRLRDLDQYKSKSYEASLKRAFLKTDEDLRSNPEYANDTSGCTAVAGLILEDNTIIVANAGDSRSVLSVGGEAKPMSYDHKPVNKGENARIVAAGGFVEFGRVNGNLALSRALGDFEFKQSKTLEAEHQIVTADPEIITHTSTSEDEFLVIACDGIWDVLKSQEVIDCVRRYIAEGKELQDICEVMMDKCLAPDSDWGGVGCDNMTVLIVALLNGKTKKEWYEWVKDRVEKGTGYATPAELPEPFTNRGQQQGGRPVLGGAPLTGPAQFLSNAINNGTLRLDQNDDDAEMDGDENYNKSPSPVDNAMIEDASTNRQHSSGSSALYSSAPAGEDKSSSFNPPSTDSIAEHALSPPSAVMGVQSSSPAVGNSKLPTLQQAGQSSKDENDGETAHPAVKADGLMDHSESPFAG